MTRHADIDPTTIARAPRSRAACRRRGDHREPITVSAPSGVDRRARRRAAAVGEPGPIVPGQTLANPVTGERFTFIHTAASTAGELLAFELALAPGGAVPVPHVHPIQTERFEILAGRMRFRVGLRRVWAEAGDVIEIRPGVLHGFANPGTEEACVRVEVRPALDMERMFAEVVALAEAGRMTRRGRPRSPLDLARLARTYDQVAHAPFLSVPAQRLLLAPLTLAARHPGAAFAAGMLGTAAGAGGAAIGLA